MSGKIILNLAMSIDGYIADENGGFDWIKGQGDTTLDSGENFDFNKFLENIDIVVMGRNCFNQNFHNDFSSKKVYVATSENKINKKNLNFINGNIVDIIKKEKDNGKNIFLFGGGILVDNFLKEKVIDEYIIGIIPIILGGGRKLFLDNNPKIELNLVEKSLSDGVVILRYVNRKEN